MYDIDWQIASGTEAIPVLCQVWGWYLFIHLSISMLEKKTHKFMSLSVFYVQIDKENTDLENQS